MSHSAHVHLRSSFFFASALLLTLLVPVRTEADTSIDSLLDRSEKLKLAGNYEEAYAVLGNKLNTSATLLGREKATLWSEMGVIDIYRSRYGKALGQLHAALKVFEAENDSTAIADNYEYIAAVHHAQKSLGTARSYYLQSLRIRKELGDTRSLGLSYNNIGSLYEDEGQYEKAMFTHRKSHRIWEELKDTSWILVSLDHLGYCFQKMKRYEEAKEHFLHAQQLATRNGSQRNIINISIQLGLLFLEMGELEKAEKWCTRVYDMSVEDGKLYGKRESCKCLHEIAALQNDPEKDLFYYRQYIAARDSMMDNNRMKELTELELNYRFDREQLTDSLKYATASALKDARIKRQNIGLFSIGSSLLLILILALSIYHGKRKSDVLLLNILPATIASELKATGKAQARKLENVTVLFTDFKGFTAIAEQLAPETLVHEIDQCFSAFDRITRHHGVEKIKTIGDAYMAAGGVPEKDPHHATNTVKAALEIQQFMEQRAAAKRDRSEPHFEIRIGVHTGPVVAGIVGINKFQYDIWGDTVNTAARMESSGTVGKVNISEATYALVKDRFACEYRGEIEAKGKGRLGMWFASGKLS